MQKPAHQRTASDATGQGQGVVAARYTRPGAVAGRHSSAIDAGNACGHRRGQVGIERARGTPRTAGDRPSGRINTGRLGALAAHCACIEAVQAAMWRVSISRSRPCRLNTASLQLTAATAAPPCNRCTVEMNMQQLTADGGVCCAVNDWKCTPRARGADGGGGCAAAGDGDDATAGAAAAVIRRRRVPAGQAGAADQRAIPACA
jgi:hypothetical protein